MSVVTARRSSAPRAAKPPPESREGEGNDQEHWDGYRQGEVRDRSQAYNPATKK
jgi:hypothetical protein